MSPQPLSRNAPVVQQTPRKTKYALLFSGVVASTAIIILAAMNQFGPSGSVGYISSLTVACLLAPIFTAIIYNVVRRSAPRSIVKEQIHANAPIRGIPPHSSVVWKNVYLDRENSVEAHAIYRSGQYACMFDNFINQARTYNIINLETGKTIKSVESEDREHLVAFTYPYLITRVCKEHSEPLINIRDVSSASIKPKMTFPFKWDFCSATFDGKTLVLTSTRRESMQPKYITIIKNIEIEDGITTSDGEIGVNSAIQIYKGWLVYSTLAGCLKMVSLDDSSNVKVISPDGGSAENYMSSITKDNFEEFVEKNSIHSLSIDGDICVGSTKDSLKVWNLSSKTLQKTIKREDDGLLLSQQDRFIIESGRNVKIWDIFAGTICYQTEKRDACNIPHLTLYKNSIFRVNTRYDEKPCPDIRI